MNKTLLFGLFVILYLPLIASAQTNKVNKKPVGKWKFEALYVPEEYNSGTINIEYANKKYSATLMFKGGNNKLNGENVKFKNDTLSFYIEFQGENVSFMLKYVDKAKMAGKALSSSEEIPITLTKEAKKK
jgi:hypothetical protein